MIMAFKVVRDIYYVPKNLQKMMTLYIFLSKSGKVEGIATINV